MRKDPIIAAIVSVTALSLYLLTLAPTISWAHHGADGGDLIAAAATLGVAHPPGYPTYVLLGHLFSRLPIGDVAYRLNLMSAVCMALAAGFTTLGVARAAGLTQPANRFPAAMGGLAFAAAPMVWSQALIAEVHALNALFVSAVMCLIAPALSRREPISTRALTVAAFVWGVGLGNLVTLAALAPIVLVALWRSPRHLAAFCLGLGIYALVPLRASAHPPINWGYAVTWPNLAVQVSAQLYRPYVFGLPPNEYPGRLIAFAQLWVTQFGWPGVLLGALGIWRAVIRSDRGRLPIGVSIGLYTIFALGYNTADSDLYLIPVWLFGAWAIALGGVELINRITRRIGGWIGIMLAVVVVTFGPVCSVASRYASLDLSQDRRADEFTRAIWADAPAHAILVTGSDAHTFTLWYDRLVEGRRPDVAIVDVRLAGYAWYAPMLIAQGSAPRLPALDPEETWIARLVTANPSRPVCRIDPFTQALVC